MNKKLIEVARQIASQEFNRKLEISTTYCVAAMIIAMDKAHAKVNYDKWFESFAEIYPEVCSEPHAYIRQAEEIAGVEIDIGFADSISMSRIM